MRKTFKIVKLLALRQGTSERTGQEWKSREVVLESTEAVMYPDLIVATLRGEWAETPDFREGDIVEQGTHKELLAKGGYYAKLYASQFE